MRLYLQLNEPGSGEITLPLDSTQAVDVEISKFIGVSYRATDIGGFFVENMDARPVNAREGGGRFLGVSGRGAMAILEDAIVWDYLTPGDEAQRIFSTFPRAAILITLLEEARDIRGCFPMLDWDFTGWEDSEGTPWTDTDEIKLRVGTTLLDVMRQFAEFGIDFSMEHYPPTGQFVLHAYSGGLGENLSDTIIFRVGHNCTEVVDARVGSEIRNAILVEYNDPISPYDGSNEDAGSIAAYRRRESLLQAASAADLATAQSFGAEELDNLKDLKRTVTISVTDAEHPYVFVEYNLGDTVGYDDGTGTIVDYRILAMELTWKDNEYASVVLTLNCIPISAAVRELMESRKLGGASHGSPLRTVRDINPYGTG